MSNLIDSIPGTELTFWAYMHENMTIHVKRYWEDSGPECVEDARESDLVVSIIHPFKAFDSQEAANRVVDYMKFNTMTPEVHLPSS